MDQVGELYNRPRPFYLVFGVGEWSCVDNAVEKGNWVTIDDEDTTWPMVARDLMRVGFDVVAVVTDGNLCNRAYVAAYVDTMYVITENAVECVIDKGPIVWSQEAQSYMPTFIVKHRDEPAIKKPMTEIVSIAR